MVVVVCDSVGIVIGKGMMEKEKVGVLGGSVVDVFN